MKVPMSFAEHLVELEPTRIIYRTVVSILTMNDVVGFAEPVEIEEWYAAFHGKYAWRSVRLDRDCCY